jgi:hypothetical protein
MLLRREVDAANAFVHGRDFAAQCSSLEQDLAAFGEVQNLAVVRNAQRSSSPTATVTAFTMGPLLF